MMPVKLLLHYPNNERQTKNAVYQGGLAWEYFGIYPFGVKRETCYLVYNEDIGIKDGLIPFTFQRVVDIDINASESMGFLDIPEKIEEKGPQNSKWRRITPSKKVPINGKSFRARKTLEFDSEKKTFLDGYLMKKNEVSKPKADIMTLIAGAGLGGLLVLAVQKLIELGG